MEQFGRIEIKVVGHIGNEPLSPGNFDIREIKSLFEFYFYGTVINAGGKDKTNIHLQTKDYGLIIIATPKEILEKQKENILYRHFSVRAKGRQNISTREIDPTSFELLEMIPFDPNYNEQYLANLIKKASPRWKGVHDADKWLSKNLALSL